MRPIMTLTLAALAAAAPVVAGDISPELTSRMRSDDPTEVIVYFHDDLAISAEAGQSQEAVLRRLKGNLERSRSVVHNELGFAAADLVRQENWISNSISMKLDAEQIRSAAQHPAVKRILWDAPVEPAQTVAPTTDRAPESDFTYGLLKLGVDKVWGQLGVTGAGVRLGNIDTGADGSHPDLAGKIVGYFDPSGSSTEPTDTHGHGTHTAATMVGGNAGGSHIGVAPDAELLVGRGIAGSNTLSNLLSCMEWMIDPDGDASTNDSPVVVSMSWHSGGGDQTPFYEAIAALSAAGIIPNFSAGNSGNSGLTHPKEHPDTVTNAASDSNDNIASFSSRGPAFYNGEEQLKPEWAAPGVDVYSAKPGGGYTNMSGTSMAAPHGAGVIGLMFQANPDLTPAQVEEVLIATAVDLGEPGWDPAFGNGRLDAFAAVSFVASGGKVAGAITDADGAALSWAKVTVVERAFTTDVKEDGTFKLLLPEGTYTLEAKAFGYLTATATISVEKDGEYEVALALEQAESFEVTGVLSASEGGATVSGRVQVLDTPLPAVETGDDGAFAITLPQGTYTFQALAFGFEVTTKQVTVPEGDASMALDPLPPILVVDDDQGKNYETYYQAALQSLGLEFGVLAGTSSLDDQTLLPYETIVWFTGNDSSSTLTADEISRLTAYLANGGRLIISGQDIGYDLKTDPFFEGTLKAKYVKDNAGVKQVSGLGLDLAIEGGDGANNQRYPEVVEALEGGEAVFQYAQDKGVAGVATANTLYLGFGLEAVDSAEDRAALMGALFEKLDGSEGVDTVSGARRGVARRDTFGQLFD